MSTLGGGSGRPLLSGKGDVGGITSPHTEEFVTPDTARSVSTLGGGHLSSRGPSARIPPRVPTTREPGVRDNHTPGAITLIAPSLLLRPLVSSYTPTTSLATCLLLSSGAITLIVPSFITSSLLVYTYHPTDVLPSLFTTCIHYHCPVSSLLLSPLLSSYTPTRQRISYSRSGQWPHRIYVGRYRQPPVEFNKAYACKWAQQFDGFDAGKHH